MIAILQDLYGFAEQFVPNPITLFKQYRFSPVDLRDLSIEQQNEHHPVSDGASITTTKSSSTPTKLATFDILSYNINNTAANSASRRKHILRAIFSSGADILLLQETNSAWEDLLKDDAIALQFQYTYFHHPGPNDRATGGIAILSQYPLENVKILDFSNIVRGSVFPALTCQVKVPIVGTMAVTIDIGNVHLRPPVNLDGTAWLNTMRETEQIRVKEVKELIQQSISTIYSEQPPLDIIAGDFNENDNGEALTYLTSLGYTDALQQYVPRYKETHTWPFLRKFWFLRKRLDHILWQSEPLTATSSNGSKIGHVQLKCLQCGVMTGYEHGASDHQPVLARFAIVKK